VDLKTGRFRKEFTLGINSGAAGFDGRITWSQDSARRVRREEGEFETAAAIDQAYLFSMAYWFPGRLLSKTQFLGQRREAGRVYSVVSVEPSMGRSFELWFDADTRLLSRSIEPGFFQTFTSYYSNFKPVQGILLPFSIRTGSGDPRFDRLEEVQGIQLNPRLDPQSFAEPKEGGPDFTLKSALPVTMPFRPAVNLVIVEAAINGRKMPFVLDTGAVNILFPETVAELGLRSEGQLSGFGGGQNEIITSQVRIESFDFASAHYRPQVFLVYPFPDLRKVTGVPDLAGILGYEIFKRFVVKVDYPRHELTFITPETYQYSGDGVIIPFHFVGNGVEVDGTIDAIPGRFLVDTGNTGSLILHSPWVAIHRDQFGNAFAKTYTATGAAGGNAEFGFATIDLLTLGSASFNKVVGALSLQSSGATASRYGTGIVGAELFLKSVVIFDYQRQRIILENAHR
jgi:hypothetical protein